MNQKQLNNELIEAVRENNSQETKDLLDLKANPNSDIFYYKLLYLTFFNRYFLSQNTDSIVTLLLDHKADIHNEIYPGYTALHIAAYHQDLETCTQLIEYAKKDEKVYLSFLETKKILLLINNRSKKEKKIIFTKPILSLIINYIEPIKVLLEKKVVHHGTSRDQKMAYELPQIKFQECLVLNMDKFYVPHTFFKHPYYTQEESAKRCETIEKLLNPEHYKNK